MNNNFLKIYFLILISFLGYSQQNIASIEIVHFDSSLNYAPGSSVSIHFNPLGIYDFRDDGDDNQFHIELSNSSGTFDNDTVVLDQSISDSFFTTTLNGVIPTINEVGTYKLRVIATKALLSNGSYGQLSSSTSVDITILTNVTGDILTTYSSTPNSGDLFDCSDQGVFHTDAMFGLLLAESSTTSGEIFANRRKIRVNNFDSNTAVYNIKRVDVINDNIFDIGSLQTSSHTISGNLGIGTYNFQVTKTLSNGVSSSYSIVFVLHRSTTTIANDSGEEICVGNIVNFNIDTDDAGIGQNYRGSYYTIDFGDDSELELYTHAEILYDNTLSHVFDNLSCNLDSGFFVVDKQQFNKYRDSNSSNCEYSNIGNGVQKNINTSLSPEAFFDSDSICEDQDLIVTNLTTLGQYGTNGCLDDATFYWEISNPNGDEFFPAFEYGEIIDDPNGWLTPNDNPENNLLDITIPSSQVIAGCWEFRLIAINDDFCQTVSYFPPQNQSPYIVNVETFPENIGIFDFDIMSDNQEVSSICVGGSVSLIDNSNLNNLNCQNPSYQWTISPESGYSFVNPANANSQNPQIIFTEAGVYTITQEITNLCGTTISSQELLIEGSPSVSFSNSSDQICVISTSIPYVVDFSSMYIPNYSDIPYAPSSFLWSISGANVDQSDYNFINGTSANDPYPIISFNDFRDFTINLTVDGDCQDSNSDQIILFINQIPEINNSNNSQTLCSGDFTNDILFESSFSSGVNYSWTTNSDSNISGYFNNGVGSGLPSHQLTNISNVSGNVTYTVTPYTNDCVGESIDFTFTIDPKPIISDKTLVICTNQSFNLINSLTSSDILPEGTIFTWDLPISSPDNAVSGGVQGSNSNIIQTLTNNTTSPAILSYLVSSSTPQDCNGNNFNLNVIVNPTAQVDQPLDQVVCNLDEVSVLFSTQNTGGSTSYSWVSDTQIGAGLSGTGDMDFTATNITTEPVVATITVTPTFENGGIVCDGENKTFTITVNPTAQVDDITNQVVCNLDEVNVLFSTQNTSGTSIYNWTSDVEIGAGLSGTGDMDFTATNLTTEPVVATITVTPTFEFDGKVCDGEDKTFTITVNPTAQVDQPLDQVVCNLDEVSVLFSTQNTGGSTSYSWVSDTQIGAGLSGTGDMAFTATNITTEPVVATITVTPTFEFDGKVCDGENKTFTITVNPTAQVDDITNQLVCNGDATSIVEFATQNTGGTTTYAWTNNTPSIGLSGSGSGDILAFTATNITTAPVVATITVTPIFENGGKVCDGEDKTFTITVNPTAQVDQPLDQVVCNLDEVSVLFSTQNTGGSTSYSWVSDTQIGAGLSGTGDMDFTATNITTEPVVATITVTPTFENGGIVCDGEDKTFTITVNPTVEVNALSDQYITSGQTSSLVNISSSTTNVTFNWTAVADSGITGLVNFSDTDTTVIPAETLFNSGSEPLNVTYTIYPVLDSPIDCPADPVVYKVIVNPTPSISFIEDKLLCDEQLTSIIFISGTSGGNVTYNWTSDIEIGAGLSGTGDMNFTATNLTTAPIVATITVTPIFENGGVTNEGDSVSFTITVNPSAQVEQPTDQLVCNSDTTSIVEFATQNTGGTTTYAWTNNTPSIGLSGSGSGDILAFTATNITTEPLVATITVTPTFENGGIVCDGEDKTFTITVNPIVEVNALSDQYITSGQTSSLVNISSSTTNVTFNWTAVADSGITGLVNFSDTDTTVIPAETLFNSGSEPLNVTYTIYPVLDSPIDCPADPIVYKVIVNPIASVISVEDQLLCNEQLTSIIFISGTSGGNVTYNWTSDIEIGAGLSGNDNMNFTATNLTTAPIVATITVTPIFENGGVTNEGDSVSFTITVNPSAQVEQPTNQVVCNSDTTSIVEFATQNTGGTTTYAWTNNTPSIGLSGSGSGDILAFTATNITTAPVVATITVTPAFENGGIVCDGEDKTFTITVNPTAQVDQPLDQVVCNEEQVNVLFTTENIFGLSSYSWSSDIEIGAGLSGTGDMDFTATNITTEPLVATITVTPTFEFDGKVCDGEDKNFTITVNPTAQVDQPIDQVVYHQGTTTSVLFTTENTGGITTYTWTNNTPSIGLSGSGSGDILAFTATNTTSIPVTAIITVTPVFENGGVVCDGENKTFTITVNPTAQVDDITNQVVCNLDEVNVLFSTQNTSGTSIYNWTSDVEIGAGLSGTGDMNFTATNLTTAPIVATISVIPSFTSGGITNIGDVISFTITVNPTAQVDQPLDQVVCNLDEVSVLFSTQNTGGSTSYSWVSDTQIGAGLSGTGDMDFTATNITTEPVVATITVTPTFENGGIVCDGEDKTFTITVNPTVEVNALSDQYITSGQTSSLVNISSSTTNVTFNWTAVADSGITGLVNFSDTDTTVIPAETLFNSGSEPLNVTYTIYPVLDSPIDCPADPIVYKVIVNPIASVISVEDQLLCNEQLTSIIFISGTSGGNVTYNWTSDIEIGAGLSGNDNMNFTATNLTTAPIVATITVTPIFENGGVTNEGDSVSFTITVNPSAQVEQPTDQLVCNSDTTSIVEFATQNTGGTTTYAWTNNTPSIGLSGSGSGDILAFTATNITTEPLVATITVTPTFENGGIVCDGEDKTFTITVNPTAQVDQPLDQVVCNEEQVNVLFTTENIFGLSSYSWSSDIEIGAGLSGTGDMDFTATNITTEPLVATITVTPTFEFDGKVCDGEDKNFTITVNPTAQVDQPIDQVVYHQGTTTSVLFTTENTGGITTYTWTNNTPSIGLSGSGSGDILAFTATNTTSTPVTAIITVTPVFENGGVVCDGENKTFTITVNPTAQVDDITNQVVCNLDEVNVLFSTQNTSGTSIYNWTSDVEIGAGLSGTGDMNFTATNLTTEPIVATISVIPSFTSGGITNIGDVISFTITVNPTAQVDQPLDQVVCNLDEVSVLFSTQNTGGSTSYSWVSDTQIGAGLSGTGDMDFTATNITTEPVVATITVTPTFENGGIVCDGENKTFTITVNPTAQVDDITNQVVCNLDEVNVLFSTQNTSGTSIYNWTSDVEIGAGLSGTGDMDFTATNLTTEPVVATITVTPTFEFDGKVCDGEDKTFTITVNPTAQVDQPLDQVVCNLDEVSVLFSTQNTGGSTSYSWVSDTQIGAGLSGTGDMAFTATNITTEPVVATITVTPTFEFDGKVCDGENKTFTITVNPTAQVDDITNQLVCNGDATSIVEFATQNTGGTTTYAWTNNTPSIGLSGSGSGDILAFTATNITTAPVVATITVTPIFENGGKVCDGEDKTFTITVNPTAQVDQPLDQVVCNLDEVSVLFSTQNTGGSTSYSWVSDTQIGAGLSGTGDMAFTATNITTEPVVATITVTPTFEFDGKVCDGENKTFTITVNPNADMNGIENQVVCHGESTESIIFSTNNLNGVMSYTWTNNTPSIGLSGSGSGDILAFTATNTTSTPVTASITVTPTFGFDNVVCDGEQKIFTITVNPTAQVEQPQDQTVCNGDDVIVEFFTNNAVGNISYSWFADIDIGLGLTGEGDLNFTAINQTTSPIISNISVVSTFEDGLNNCTGAVKNFVIKVNPTAQVNPVQDVFICEGEMSSVIDFTTINSNGIVSYTWINDNTDIGLITNGVGSIESFVAENPTNEIITANLIVTPTYSNDGVLCLGPSENFSISVSPKPEMNEVITNVNCSYSEPLCVASIQISPDGIGPFVYNWVSLDGNDIINPTNQDQFDLCPGSYRVMVTDGSNCSYSYEYQVSPPESIEFTLVTLTNLSCNNIGSEFCDGSIEVLTDGGSYPYAIQEWYTESIPGSGDFDLGPLVNINNPNQLVNACQGNYVYKVLDANGCEFISPVYTIDAAPSQVNISETISNYNGYNIDCFSSNSGLLEIEVSGGSGIFDFSLTNDQTGQIIDSSQNQIGPLNLVFDFLTAGDYTFILIDSNCSSEIIRNYNLTEPDELQIIATLVSPPTCYSGLATYDISATGGVPPYIGTGLQSVLSGPASFTVIDSNDCSDDYSTIVADPEELSVEYSTEDALCFGGNGLITINPDGGTGIITVNIYDENFLFIESSLTSQSTPISFIQPNGTYFFDFYDDNDCYFGPQLVVINEPEPILVDIDIIQPNCNSDPEWSFNNGSICISITGGINPMPIGVNWIDNGNGNWCLTDLSDGTYPVVIVDENGCEPINEIQNVVLTSPTPITVDFNNSIDVDCDTNTITQTNFIFVDGGQPPYEITWSGGIYDPLNSNIMETSVEGNYSAFVNDQLGILNGCPPLEFQLDPIIFQEFGYSDFTFSSANSDFCDIFAVSDPINFTNISSGDIVNFEWNFGDGSPIITNIQSPTHVYDVIGDYTVILTVEDVYGCTDSYSQIIEITKGYEIINPNAFTPNGDGINDTIRPVYNCMTNVKMSIYDTWGSLIYTESGEDIYGWDGNIDGNPAENGNYIMVVEAETFNGTVLNLNGPVTLIK